MAAASSMKSTNVRVLRTFLRVADVVAPGLAGRAATDLWFRLPPALRPAPVPPGGEPFEVTSLGAKVRGRVWGGDGPVVYLVHGWGGRGDQLAGYVQPLLDRGHRIVMFDGPAHGLSDPGPSAPTTNGLEFGRALDAVGSRFGPARAVVAHSMGAAATVLTLKYGWLSTERLVLLAPMVRLSSSLDDYQRMVGLGSRGRRRMDREILRRVGLPVPEFDLSVLTEQVDPVPTLVVHDRRDRQTPYTESARLAEGMPQARFLGTEGLGHRRVLSDPAVTDAVVGFVDTGELAVERGGDLVLAESA